MTEPVVEVRHGDCKEIIATLADESVHAIVTDPPYELGFIGKKWDNTGISYDIQLWTECLRVLKPGGHLLAFGGTRTYHRMACAIEDAGFEIRDSIHWLYGSGFPKSHDVSKAIDKVNGEPDRLLRFTLWFRTTGLTVKQVTALLRDTGLITENGTMAAHYFAKANTSQPAIPTAAMWAVIRPHVTDVPKWVDELVARIEAEREVVGATRSTTLEVAPGEGRERPQVVVPITAPATDAAREWEGWGTALKPAHEPIVVARKPLTGTVAANVLQHGTGALNIDGARVATPDELGMPQGTMPQLMNWGDVSPSGSYCSTGNTAGRWPANVITDGSIEAEWVRYFFTAKASKGERNAGGTIENRHPTVKPLALMRYLVRLVTPPGGIVLEPFAGSGTTLAAAILEGFDAIGCELTDDYLPIIENRIKWAQQQRATKTESLFD